MGITGIMGKTISSCRGDMGREREPGAEMLSAQQCSAQQLAKVSQGMGMDEPLMGTQAAAAQFLTP